MSCVKAAIEIRDMINLKLRDEYWLRVLKTCSLIDFLIDGNEMDFEGFYAKDRSEEEFLEKSNDLRPSEGYVNFVDINSDGDLAISFDYIGFSSTGDAVASILFSIVDAIRMEGVEASGEGMVSTIVLVRNPDNKR